MITLDFRSKLVVFFSTVFLVSVLSQNTVLFLLIIGLSIYLSLLNYKRELKKILFILLIIEGINFITKGGGFTVLVPQVFLFIVTRTSIILMSSTPIFKIPTGELMSVMKKMRINKNISLPLIFMMRFFPTIKSELKEIKDSLKLRNMYNWSKPLLTMEYIFVPMMFSASRIAEELAAAAEVRGISTHCEHTSRRKIKFGVLDLVVVILSIVSMTGLYYLERKVFI